MAEVVLFHHVQGLTEGVRRLADELRAGGHTVHTPDFFDGETFDSIDDGFAALRAAGEGALDAWADALVAELPNGDRLRRHLTRCHAGPTARPDPAGGAGCRAARGVRAAIRLRRPLAGRRPGAGARDGA